MKDLLHRIRLALRVFKRFPKDSKFWDRPNGWCSACGAPLNNHLMGGHRLHDKSIPEEE